MDSAVSSTLLSQLQNFSSSALSQFNTILPLALGLIITITLVTMAVRWFMNLTGMSH